MVLTSIQFLEILEPRSQLLLVPPPSIAIPSQRNVPIQRNMPSCSPMFFKTSRGFLWKLTFRGKKKKERGILKILLYRKLNFSPQFFENWQTPSSFLSVTFEKRRQEGIKKFIEKVSFLEIPKQFNSFAEAYKHFLTSLWYFIFLKNCPKNKKKPFSKIHKELPS